MATSALDDALRWSKQLARDKLLLIMNTSPHKSKLEKITLLAQAIYELAKLENNSEDLELLRKVAVEAASTFDQFENELHPDLGLDLILYIELKRDHKKDPKGAVSAHLVTQYENDYKDILTYVRKKLVEAADTEAN